MRPNWSSVIVYNFSFETSHDQKITVKFYNKTNFIFCGTDHAAPHNLRRNWALSLTGQPNWTWTILKSHPYLDFLRNNDFTYKEALTVKKSHKIRVLYRDYNTTFSLNLPFGHLFYVIRFLSSSAYSNVLKSSKGLWYKVYLLYASDCCMPSVNKFGVNYGCSSQMVSPAALCLPIAAGDLFGGQGTIHGNQWCKLKANSLN